VGTWSTHTFSSCSHFSSSLQQVVTFMSPSSLTADARTTSKAASPRLYRGCVRDAAPALPLFVFSNVHGRYKRLILRKSRHRRPTGGPLGGAACRGEDMLH